jgi:anti-sigma B factor antagonist
MTLVAVGDMPGDGRARETGLRIEVREQDEWAVVAFAGELDLEEAGAAGRALADAHERGSRGVVADLREVTFLGSTGMRVLLEAQALCEGAGRRMRVVQGDGPASRLIALLGLGDRMDLVDGDG